MSKYRCISDQYSQHPEEYASLDEFRAACFEVFGDAPILEAHTFAGNAYYRDGAGEIVLQVID